MNLSYRWLLKLGCGFENSEREKWRLKNAMKEPLKGAMFFGWNFSAMKRCDSNMKKKSKLLKSHLSSDSWWLDPLFVF